MDNVIIANNTISIKEYQGQRVVTFKDIDTVHNRPDGTARRNFNTNKKHFIEGEDYFKVCANEIRTVGITSPNGGTVVTESGYLMLVKSFTDDLSWDVQRELVKSYFRVKQEAALAEPNTEVPEYKYIDKTYHAQPIFTAADICHLFPFNHMNLYQFIKSRLSVNTDYALLQGEELRDYLNENPSIPRCRKSVYIIYWAGIRQIVNYFGLEMKNIPSKITETRGYVVQTEARKVMEYVRRELKGIEALTYLVESDDTPSNLENYRKILVRKLAGLRWWEVDVETVKLGIHRINIDEVRSIHNGEYGMRY